MKRLKRSLSLRSSRRHIPESQRPQVWENDSYKVRNGGVSFPVKYVGSIEVTESRGTQVCAEAYRKMRDAGVHKKKRMNLLVTADCIRVVDEETKSLSIDQTIEKVSFCTPDPSDDRVFSYICREGTTRRWMCHCFVAVRDTGERLSHAVGCAFTACLQRKQKAQALQQAAKTKEDGQPAVPATNSAQPQTSQQTAKQTAPASTGAPTTAGGSPVMNGPTSVPGTATPHQTVPTVAASPQPVVQPVLKPPPPVTRVRTQPFAPSPFTRHMSLRYRSTPMSHMPLRDPNVKGGYETLHEDPGMQAPKLPSTVDALGLQASPVQPLQAGQQVQPITQPHVMSTSGFSPMQQVPAPMQTTPVVSPNVFNGIHAPTTSPAIQQPYGMVQTTPQYMIQQQTSKQWQPQRPLERKISDADRWLASAEGSTKNTTSNQGLLTTHNPFSETASEINALSTAWTRDLNAALPAANQSSNNPWGTQGVQQLQEDDEFASLATRHTGSPTGSPRSPANPFNQGPVHWV